jgi:hypothetical protein
MAAKGIQIAGIRVFDDEAKAWEYYDSIGSSNGAEFEFTKRFYEVSDSGEPVLKSNKDRRTRTVNGQHQVWQGQGRTGMWVAADGMENIL